MSLASRRSRRARYRTDAEFRAKRVTESAAAYRRNLATNPHFPALHRVRADITRTRARIVRSINVQEECEQRLFALIAERDRLAAASRNATQRSATA